MADEAQAHGGKGPVNGLHDDGGRIVDTVADHDHVEHHPDGSVSAVSVTGVPAKACELCGATFYDDEIGFALAELVAAALPPAGRAVTVEFERSRVA